MRLATSFADRRRPILTVHTISFPADFISQRKQTAPAERRCHEENKCRRMAALQQTQLRDYARSSTSDKSLRRLTVINSYAAAAAAATDSHAGDSGLPVAASTNCPLQVSIMTSSSSSSSISSSHSALQVRAQTLAMTTPLHTHTHTARRK